MGENNLTPKNIVEMSVERYNAILEANMEQSIEINNLKKALLQADRYSMELSGEIYRLNEEHYKELSDLRAEMQLMCDFLNNNHLVADYNAFANQTAVEV